MDLRLVDWRRLGGEQNVGIWEGDWVTRRGRLTYRVEASRSRSGTLRVKAARRSTRGGRWLTVREGVAGAGQEPAVLGVAFEASRQDAAQRLPS